MTRAELRVSVIAVAAQIAGVGSKEPSTHLERREDRNSTESENQTFHNPTVRSAADLNKWQKRQYVLNYCHAYRRRDRG